MSDINQTRIEEALNALYEEGIKHYNPEYQQGADKWEAIGLAMTHDYTANRRSFAKLAYSAWEDWNAHSLCSVLDWVFDLYPDSGYMGDLDAIKAHISKERTIKTTWNWDTMKHDTARYRVTVNIEKIED